MLVTGNRKALVEKSGLVKHAASQKKARELQKQQSIQERTNTHRSADMISVTRLYVSDVIFVYK